MKCPKCGSECVWDEDDDFQTGHHWEGWFCEECLVRINDDPREPPEPDLNCKSARESYIEAWHEHQRLHRR